MKNKKLRDAYLFIDAGFILFVGQVIDTNPHAHHFIQLVLSPDNNFTVEFGNNSILTSGIIIGPDVVHRLISRKGIQVLLLIDPESYSGREIMATHLNAETWKIYTDKKIHESAASLLSDREGKKNSLKGLSEIIISDLTQNVKSHNEIDDRIIRVIKKIKESEEKKVSVDELAGIACLSVSRLQHLFKNDIGISIKRYLLWERLVNSIKLIKNNLDLTTAAIESGFADSAHMSRTFTESFGVNLSEIFKNSRSIQVSFSDIL